MNCFEKLMVTIKTKTGVEFGNVEVHAHGKDTTTKSQIIPPQAGALPVGNFGCQPPL